MAALCMAFAILWLCWSRNPMALLVPLPPCTLAACTAIWCSSQTLLFRAHAGIWFVSVACLRCELAVGATGWGHVH
jgi:hypothetical protein